MKKTKLTIHQPKIKGCDDSFFYEGLIAEKGKYKMFAYGEIRIKDKNGSIVDLGTFEDDSDLEMVNDEDFSWDMNNWFEIGKDDDNFLGNFISYSYKEAIKHLKSL